MGRYCAMYISQPGSALYAVKIQTLLECDNLSQVKYISVSKFRVVSGGNPSKVL